VEVEPICSCEYQKSRLDDILWIMLPPNHFSNTEKADKAGKVLLLLDLRK